jgi:hypothetical protein
VSAGPDGGLELGAGAAVAVQLGRVADLMQAQWDRRQKLLQQLNQVPIVAPQISLTAGAGTLQLADLLGPRTGYHWSVRRLSLNGYTAGTVTVYKNASGGEILLPTSAAGTYTFGRGEMLLEPSDQMVFVAAGITGYVQVGGAADCFESWLLPDYLM